MTYEERTNAIGTLLRETILPRYTRPPHLDDATARLELRDMVDDLNAQWPVTQRIQFELLGKALARSLRLTYTGRTWPTIAHMAKALKAAIAAPASAIDRPSQTTAEDEESWKRAQVRAWLYDRKPVNPVLVTMERLIAVDCNDPADAYRFAHNPRNEGIDDKLTPADRDRHAAQVAADRARYPGLY